MHAALHGAEPNSTDLGGFLIRQALRPNQDQSFPILWRKSCERFAQVPELAPRILILGWPKVRRIGPVRVRNLVFGLSILAVEQVAQDREQPRTHIGARLELPDVGQSPNDRILHEVVGMIRAVSQRHREGPQARESRQHRLTHPGVRPLGAAFVSRRRARALARLRASDQPGGPAWRTLVNARTGESWPILRMIGSTAAQAAFLRPPLPDGDRAPSGGGVGSARLRRWPKPRALARSERRWE